MKRYITTTVSLLPLIQLIALSSTEGFDPIDYCVYGESCWPSKDVFEQLEANNPTLDVVLRGDPEWEVASELVLNTRVAKTPGATIYAMSADDIITVVNFTQTYNMNLKIVSSGHEFIGRNTAEGCLQLSLLNMINTSVDLDCPENAAGCLTAEPGVRWLQAYRVANSVDRIVVGGTEPSVSVTGWSLGGGHSSFSPTKGFGADQIVELSMVLADLSYVTLNKGGMVKRHINGTVTSSNDTDLFWAARGGGGGTFGVVTSIKFKLHMPPSKFTTMLCDFSAIDKPKESMQEIKKGMREVIVDLPNEFGGYLLTGALCYTETPRCKMAVFASYLFVHYGARSENAASFDKLDAKAEELSDYLLAGPCTTTEYDAFYNYVETFPNTTRGDVDIDGTFLSPTEYTDEFIDKESAIFATAFYKKEYFLATWIRLGGQTKNDSSGATAINPLFRNAMWTIAYGGDEGVVQDFDELVEETVETKGQYFNECDDDLPEGEWQRQLWGEETYSELLTVKRKYDSENHFTCLQCVGSVSSEVSKDSAADHLTSSAAVTLLFACLQQLVNF